MGWYQNNARAKQSSASKQRISYIFPTPHTQIYHPDVLLAIITLKLPSGLSKKACGLEGELSSVNTKTAFSKDGMEQRFAKGARRA
jgi:hypothetical protein